MRRVLQSDLAIQAANLALRIGQLCEEGEVRVRVEKRVAESYDRAARLELVPSVNRVLRDQFERASLSWS